MESQPPLLPPAPAAPLSSKKSGFLKTFLIVIALILFGILIGVLASRFVPMTESSTAIATPTPTVAITPVGLETPTPTIDVTADWKTYTNTTYGYSFKYPNMWTLEVDPRSKDKEFQFTLKLGEIVTGTIFEGKPKGNTFETQREFNLSNNKYLLVAYSQCLGPGCGVGSLDLPTFTQFISTFKFADISLSPQPSNKTQLREAIQGYSESIINNDRNKAMSFLTVSAQKQVENIDWPGTVYTQYKTFEVLNEYHSAKEEEDFYNTEPVKFDIKFYIENDPNGKLTSISFVREGNKWKTSTWNIFTGN